MPTRTVLCDIEGTTTSISFVHEVLFPIAAEKITGFIKKHFGGDVIKQETSDVLSEHPHLENTPEALADYFLELIKQDKKDTALKSVQGKIWQEAYEDGSIKGHIYDDVVPAWEKWQGQGVTIYIYSSGSVQAQKLIFGYSSKGDLTPYLSGYFDTNIGGKKEVSSYEKILQELKAKAGEVLFLSDVPAELDAASAAGIKVIQLKRPDNKLFQAGSHEIVSSFSEVNI